jgi:hypothetical protein
MADDHVFHQHAELGREIGKALQFIVQEPQANNNVAQQLTLGAVTEAAIVSEFGHLADIVQNRTRQQKIEVDITVVRGGDAAQIADREHMLNQAAQIRMVYVLGGGRNAIHASQRFVVQERLQQGAQVGILNAGDNTAQLGEHFRRVARGSRKVIGEIHIGIHHAYHFVDGELWAILKNLQQAFDFHKIVALEGIDHIGDVVPHLGVHFAGPVAQQQREVGFP